MKRGLFVFLLLLFFCGHAFADAFGKDLDEGLCYTNFSRKELLQDLAFSEEQIFDKIYTADDMTERLERLEIEVFGAIQDGSEDFRIKRLRKSVTNTASGGSGLNYASKTFGLAGNSSGMSNWAIGNMHNFSPYGANYRPYRNSCLLPPARCHSHRLPPPPPPRDYNYAYNSNPIVNGSFSKNYSIGTSVRILDD